MQPIRTHVGHCCFCPPLSSVGDPPKRQGLCSQSTQLWATADFVPRSEAVVSPPTAGDMQPIRPLVGQS